MYFQHRTKVKDIPLPNVCMQICKLSSVEEKLPSSDEWYQCFQICRHHQQPHHQSISQQRHESRGAWFSGKWMGPGGPRYQKLWGRCHLIIWSFLWNFSLLFYWIDFHQDVLHNIIICIHSQINSSTFGSFIPSHSFKKNIHTSQRYLCSSGLGPTLMHLSQSLGESEFAWRFSHVHWDKLN